MDWQKFLEMGGYAAYVWSGYGLTVFVLAWTWWSARSSEAEAQEGARRRNSISQETRS